MNATEFLKIPFPDDEATVDGIVVMPDDTMEPVFLKGDYLIVQQKGKKKASDYRSGDFCVVRFDGKLYVRQFWQKGDLVVLQGFAERVDVFEPSALEYVDFVGKIVSLYRRVPDVCPGGTVAPEL